MEYGGLGNAYYVTKYPAYKNGSLYYFVPRDWEEFQPKDLVEVGICQIDSDFWTTDTKTITKIGKSLAVCVDSRFGYKPGVMMTLRLRRYLPAAGSEDKERDQKGA